MWWMALLLTGTAQALVSDRSGPVFDLAAGAGFDAPPVAGGVSGLVGFGWWVGPYDDSYAIGRFWSVGGVARVASRPGGLRATPLLEVRRGVDLIVASWHGFLSAGPMIQASDGQSVVGASVRTGFGAEFRTSRFWGLTLRVEAGPDYVGDVFSFGSAMLLGFQFSRPGDGRGVQ